MPPYDYDVMYASLLFLFCVFFLTLRFFFFFPFFFFNDTATTEIYTLSLHDALPIYRLQRLLSGGGRDDAVGFSFSERRRDRKSTRLNSSHGYISYAVFCLKKKKKHTTMTNIKRQKQTQQYCAH